MTDISLGRMNAIELLAYYYIIIIFVAMLLLFAESHVFHCIPIICTDHKTLRYTWHFLQTAA